VRTNLRKFSRGVVFALLTAAIFFAGSSPYAQAQTRPFLMGLWADSSHANSDIAVFSPGQAQPAAPTRSIVVGMSAGTSFHNISYDWTRIIAVEVDEPYGSIDSSIASLIASHPFGTGNGCQGNVPSQAAAMDASLSARATELRALNPKARFWVNLTNNEAELIEGNGCWATVFNRPYIDVISADWYYVGFSEVQPAYNTLALLRAKPSQQVALIPGTFYRSGKDNPATQASIVQGYFPYAYSMNQSCNLPLGDLGATGYFDGCPVWMVLGWLAPNFQDGNTQYVGLFDPTSSAIKAVWNAELAQ
jgi:hypothetical protein